MSADQAPCRRYPCDLAYPGQTHNVVGADGSVLHIRTAGGSSSERWCAAAIARNDGPWRVAIKLDSGGEDKWHIVEDDGRYHDNPTMRAQNAIENAIGLAGAITIAVGAVAGTWLHESAEFESGADFWQREVASAG